MTRRIKIRSVLYGVLITLFVFGLCLATIILYPQPLFANKMEYKQFNIYSSEKISEQIKPVLDSAIAMVEKSELYDPTYQMDLFLGYNTFFNKVEDKIFGQGATARATGNNLVFKGRVDVEKNLVHSTFPKSCQQGFAYLIAHEMIHCLQAHTYGILKFNPFHPPEMWKLEGYPEYIARQKYSEPSLNLKKEISRYMELKNQQKDIWILVEDGGCEVQEYYYKGRLLTEYLMNVSDLTYDQIIRDKRTEDEINAEMIGWAIRQ